MKHSQRPEPASQRPRPEHCDTYSYESWYEYVSDVKPREDGDRDYDPYTYGEGEKLT